jgi:hypothetical protein
VKWEAALARELSTPDPFDPPNDPALFDADLGAEPALSPSLPIILFSAACGLGTGILSFYVVNRLLLMNLPLSAGAATLCALALLSASAGGLSVLTNSNALVNVAFGCGLIVLTVTFFAFCSLIGALAATLVIALS